MCLNVRGRMRALNVEMMSEYVRRVEGLGVTCGGERGDVCR